MLLHVCVCYVGDVEGVQPTQICCFLPCLLDTVVVSVVVVVVSEGEGVGRGPLAVVLLRPVASFHVHGVWRSCTAGW